MKQAEYLKTLYRNRFNPRQQKAKYALWKVLIDSFLQTHVGLNGRVLDIGGGYCEFINQISAAEKFLIDLNPDAQDFANPDVKVFNLDILSDIDNRLIPLGHFDAIFISNFLGINLRRKLLHRADPSLQGFQPIYQSILFHLTLVANFFEHLHNKEELIQVLSFCFDRLRPGGKLLVIQPNFKYSYREYYDFIDHHLPITDGSLSESLKAIGFSLDVMIPRFLPFSTKGRPSSTLLLKIYLKLPFLWYFLGGQMFVRASRPF